MVVYALKVLFKCLITGFVLKMHIILFDQFQFCNIKTSNDCLLMCMQSKFRKQNIIKCTWISKRLQIYETRENTDLLLIYCEYFFQGLDGRPLKSGEVCWNAFQRLLNKSIQDVINFAKRIPGFTNLDQEDQISLIKGGCFEVKNCTVTHCELLSCQ